MDYKGWPKGAARIALCFVKKYLLSLLGYMLFAAPKTILSRTKFNLKRLADPSYIKLA
ncbi:hypothetical protein GCM10009193_15610 [Shewanella aestuarii]|nr:hypothetical protein GCM10009193_15610 [Shewanella aestuarii]